MCNISKIYFSKKFYDYPVLIYIYFDFMKCLEFAFENNIQVHLHIIQIHL